MRVQFLIVLWFLISISFSYTQTFTEVAQAKGVLHTYNEVNFGGGVSFYDFNGDGWDDLTVATPAGEEIHFYKNVSGTFEKVDLGINDTSETKQLIWVDVDNDGDKDLFTAVYEGPDYMYINNGNLEFTPFPLPGPHGSMQSKTFAGAFGDYDVDGDLDLFLLNRGWNDSLPNQLLQNDGNGNFMDVTENYFFDSIYQPSFCAAFFDFNKDGFPDLYTAEDRIIAQNQFYKNVGGSYFEDISDDCGAGVSIDAMGLSVGDYNHDGNLDMYVSNGPSGNPLFHNNGNETFTDTSAFAGSAFYNVSWGNQFLDFDMDADLDLHVCGTIGNNGPNKNALFMNLGNGTFSNATDSILGFDSTISFSSGLGDFNNDGYIDVAINNVFPDSFNLWENSGGTNNWIKILLEGVVSNRDGIGSWIEIYSGGTMRTYYTICGSGFLGQNSNTQTFGLGQNSIADSIKVIWMSGEQNFLHQVDANQTIHIVEGQPNSIYDGYEEMKVEVYPVPFEKNIHIRSDEKMNTEYTFQVFTTLGQLIFSFKETNPRINEWIFPSDNWANGLYYLQISSGDKTITRKIPKVSH